MIGKYAAKMDDKNRLFVPAKLRAELGETFYVTVGFNGGRKCLTVYTAADWAKFGESFNNLDVASRSGAMGLIFMNAIECAPDKQFRFALTNFLMAYAGIEKDVTIVGRAGQAEIWDTAEFEQFEAENLTPDKLLQSLKEMGL